MLMHTFNPSIQRTEARTSLRIGGLSSPPQSSNPTRFTQWEPWDPVSKQTLKTTRTEKDVSLGKSACHANMQVWRPRVQIPKAS